MPASNNRKILTFQIYFWFVASLLLNSTSCKNEPDYWHDLRMEISGEEPLLQGMDYLGEVQNDFIFHTNKQFLELAITGPFPEVNSLLWFVNGEYEKAKSKEKFLNLNELDPALPNSIGFCLTKNGPCKIAIVILESSGSDFAAENSIDSNWNNIDDDQEQSSNDFSQIPTDNKETTKTGPESMKDDENNKVNPPLVVIPPTQTVSSKPVENKTDEERSYDQNGRAGFTESQRCVNGDQYTLNGSVKISLTPARFMELKSFKLLSTDNGRINILIQGPGEERWSVPNRSIVGGIASEINFEHLSCELRPGTKYTITVSASSKEFEFENLQACQKWNSGNKDLKIQDVSNGGAVLDIKYKY